MDSSCIGSKAALEKHQQESSPKQKKTLRCQICSRNYGSKAAFRQHERDSPMHTKTFQCETCNHSSGSEEESIHHKWNCQADQELPKDNPDASLGRNSDETAISDALARLSMLDKPAAAPILVSANASKTTPRPKKAKEKAPKPKIETREFFTFPELHSRIAEAVFPDVTSSWFNEDHDDHTFDNEWPTNLVGRFICTNPACKKQSWGSGIVFTEIRGYDDDGYNAVVYNQRCKTCNCLGTFVMDKQCYVDRVAYWVKKWAGVEVVPPIFGQKTTAEHESRFCEACKRGKCRAGR